MFQGCLGRQGSGLVRPNSANATYVSTVSATAAFSESPVADMMIEMGHNTQKNCAVITTPVLNAPSQNMGTSIVDSDPLCSVKVGPPMLPAEVQDTAAEGAHQQEDILEPNDKMETQRPQLHLAVAGGMCKPLAHPSVVPILNPPLKTHLLTDSVRKTYWLMRLTPQHAELWTVHKSSCSTTRNATRI